MTADLARCMNDNQKLAHKDEILAVTIQIPNFSTKEDIAMIHEMMKSKVDVDLLGVLQTKFEKLQENTKLYLHEKKFYEKLQSIDEKINNLQITKTHPKYVDDKINDLKHEYSDQFNKLHDFKVEIKEQINSQNKNFAKFEKSVEQKAHKDQIWEIRDEIREFVTKENLHEVEDKVFPIMDEVVKKIKMFEDAVYESKQMMVRFDEQILDKASKYDFLSLNNRIDGCAEKHFLDELHTNFERFVQNYTKIIDAANIVIDKNTIKSNEHTEAFKNIGSQIKEIQHNNENIVLKDEIIGIHEKIDSKADQIDIKNI